MRETSLAVYREIKENGYLSEMRWRVYDIVARFGPITAPDLNVKAAKLYGGTGEHYEKRLSELAELDAIEELGEIPSERTGNMATLWAVTNRKPKLKLPARETSKQKIKRLEAELAFIKGNLCLECRTLA